MLYVHSGVCFTRRRKKFERWVSHCTGHVLSSSGPAQPGDVVLQKQSHVDQSTRDDVVAKLYTDKYIITTILSQNLHGKSDQCSNCCFSERSIF